MSTDVDHAKRALRADLRRRREARPDAERTAAATALADRLASFAEESHAHSLSCYLSTSSEPGTREFISRMVARGVRVLLPVARQDGQLDWADAQPDGRTAPGLFGLPEPTGPRLGPIAVHDAALMFVPAAAIDRTGMRMGWGRGYFDRTIGAIRTRPPVYGVVFDSEILDEVPRDVHDQPVTGVVTPARTITFARDAH